MGNLISSLVLAANAMDVEQKAVGVVQNNVTNASTPGYVNQTPTFIAGAFDPQTGTTGGVLFGPVESSRSQFAESEVRSQNSLLGTATQAAASLNALQQEFSVSGTTGIPAALSNLYSAFSAWSTTPTDESNQQQVIVAAQQVAEAFNDTASSITQIASNTQGQLQDTVNQINALTGQIQQINVQIRNSGGGDNDAGLDAQLNADLESLSNLTNIDVHYQSDGTAEVLMGGQIPLVIGATQNQLKVTYSTPPNPANANAPPAATITTPDGQDVTSTVSQGTLAGLLTFTNGTLAGIMGDSQNAGSLNQLATAFANQVNSIVTPVSGIPLFTTSATPTDAAQTLAVNTKMTAATLVASSATSSNGTADQLAQLGSFSDPVLGAGYTDFYANIASAIGNQESAASANQTTQQALLTQAQNARTQLSGVSLNQSATQLIEFQQAYDASAQTVTTINNMLTALLDMTNGVP